jgi:F-type H+-transporting ATPase subunit a
MIRATQKILCLLPFLATGGTAFAAEEHTLHAEAEKLFSVGPLPVSNSMITSWVVAALLIIAVRLIVKTPKLIPSRGQAVIESILEGIMDLVGPIVGPKAIKAAFPLLMAFFTYILIQNWSGLVPGVGTIQILHQGEWHGIIRPGNADMNGTVALALVSFFAWLYLIFRFAGPKAVFLDLFGNKADKRDVHAAIYYPLFVIFFLVGLLEIISIIFRPVSLSFRLFGNVFGGENLLHSMSAICQWLLPVPFYGMELMVGFVQAFVFTLLVAVYVGLICNHGDDHGHDDAHAGHGTSQPHAH